MSIIGSKISILKVKIMMTRKTIFIDKVIFYFLIKLFGKRYKTPFSRKIYKAFFKLLQKKTLQKIDLDLNGQDLVSKLNDKGWAELKGQDLAQDFLELKQDSIEAALNIFDDNFETNATLKAYLKGIDLKQYPAQVKLFNRFFTHSNFVDPISKYLGDTPLLTELKILYSPPTKMKTYSGSQLFHSDFDDDKLVKIFVLLDEVNQDSGPTELIEKKETSLIIEKTKYNWGVKRKKFSSHDDALLDVLEGEDNYVSLKGPKGAVFCVDTVSCLHRGSRNPKKERKILYANFSTRTSFRNTPLNWLIKNNLTLLKSSPLLNLDPEGKLNLRLIENIQ